MGRSRKEFIRIFDLLISYNELTGKEGGFLKLKRGAKRSARVNFGRIAFWLSQFETPCFQRWQPPLVLILINYLSSSDSADRTCSINLDVGV